MRLGIAVVLAATLALGGCGGSDSTTAASTPKPAASTPKPALGASLPRIPDGTPTPEALSDFACDRDDKDVWRATGAVKNTTSSSVTFQVTVHVGPADGDGAVARTQRIAGVQANGSVRFDLGKIKTGSPDGPCHVQVLALR